MGVARGEDGEARFAAYVEELASVIGHADRVRPLGDYCTGLLLDCERKSVEPLAAVTAPARAAAQHQSLLHFVGNAAWSDERVLAKVRELVVPAMERQGPIIAWIIDDTSFAKKGTHSVGVTRQYCGHLGKQDNCQVAVSLSVANHAASLPVAYQLYLPQQWAHDAERRAKAGVPEEVGFATKPEIALDQIGAALAAGIPPGVVLMDAGYGADTRLRSEITALGLGYVAGILAHTTVWPQGLGPLPPKPWSGRGRPTSRMRRDGAHRPVQVKALALALPEDAWQTVTWREGSADWLASRFARTRVRAAHRDERLSQPRDEEWLLIEWPEGEAEPSKYWLATLPEEVAWADLVDLAKLRWRIERDYHELKQELGLGHYEGRGWRGFHHHATLCIAAYGFLICERQTIPPSGPGGAAKLKKPAVPGGYRPRGAADPTGTPHPQLDRHRAPPPHRGACQEPRPMPLLPCTSQVTETQRRFMTQ
jgi:SRSO17 transposase